MEETSHDLESYHDRDVQEVVTGAKGPDQRKHFKNKTERIFHIGK